MDFMIITNNPYTVEQLERGHKVVYFDESLTGILTKAREYIHKGHQLLSHPLSGSVKPYETPYKSVMISTNRDDLHMESLEIIEQSLECCMKFEAMRRAYSEKVYKDFQFIDFALIDGAVQSALSQ